ncbi:oxysterol-binding protein 1-like [Panonychus citri]|uniref:oxysterol-binding protein 1-like n=1 Tax=Panonychus citri TaxID=50023 RepID=UPI00230764F8|nr:oxysterol-binding protein 1-like [Panonychus citri]XP_053201458.1 oxysterol-binding protein 1-like [Panonychus citri]XP_053202455.1 oxysterol-binding protein 1-like [Panonychus citri]
MNTKKKLILHSDFEVIKTTEDGKCDKLKSENHQMNVKGSLGVSHSSSQDERAESLQSITYKIDMIADQLKTSDDNERKNIDMSINGDNSIYNSDSANSTSTLLASRDEKEKLNFNEKDLAPPLLDSQRRKKIPERPSQSLNLWSFLKKCIGKELTKIPMPVNFNEPLSMLQRLTEDFDYAHLLHKAATISDSCDQLVYVAAFCVSSYACTGIRLNKPFNPLLGETYECDRTSDLGWKSITEQVSHHPPMLALHCEGKGWKCWSEFGLSSKFRGKYLQVNPVDISHLEFPEHGYHYTWHKVTTTIHNIIVGKLWVDNHGDMVITNHTTGDRCLLKFIPYSYFSRDIPRKVTGKIVDSKGVTKWIIQGIWDEYIESALVFDKRTSAKGKSIYDTSPFVRVWQKTRNMSECEKMYNLTALAVQLNEPEEGVAPTDSRLRPDQRLMEEGKWDEANQVKGLLEEKQRSTRRKREEEAATNPEAEVSYAPSWFKLQIDPITNNPVHVYNGDYWQCKQKQDWSRCPVIFNCDKENDLKSVSAIGKV